jgi:hypothetical protein
MILLSIWLLLRRRLLPLRWRRVLVVLVLIWFYADNPSAIHLAFGLNGEETASYADSDWDSPLGDLHP